MYSEKVLKRFKKPKFAGVIKNPDGIGKVGNTRCGDVMKIYIKVEKKKGKEYIKDIKFHTFGCVAAIASSDVLCELAKGKTIEQAEKIRDKDIAKALDGLPQIKVHCSVLGASALHEAIKDYKSKNP